MRIPFLKASFPQEAISNLTKILTSGFVGAGKEVERFEEKLKKFLGVKYLLYTSSCTGALTLAYKMSGIDTKTKVLTTPMTCAATNVPLLHFGAQIEWLDVDPITGNVTKETLENSLIKNSDAKVVIIMDWGGNPCDYRDIENIAKKYNLKLILDAAQSFGSLYKDSLVGSQADFICYSFGPTKILSSIEGGAIIAKDNLILSELKKLQWYGIDRSIRDPIEFWNNQIENAGYRFTNNDIFASIGLFMLNQLAERIDHNRRIASIYCDKLRQIDGIIVPELSNEIKSNYWLFTLLVENRLSLLTKLHQMQIHAAIPHTRNDELICFDNLDRKDLPGVDYFSQHYLCLPIGTWVSEEDAIQICETIVSGW